MERNIDIIKLDQQLAHIATEIKQMDTDKLELSRQIHNAEAVLPQLKSELEAAHRDAETKRKNLEHPGMQLHKRIIKDVIHHTEQKSDNLEMMTKKAAIDREYQQKEREHERKTVEAKLKLNDLKKKTFDLERRYQELMAHKRDIEREKEAILQKVELAKREAAAKAAKTPKVEQHQAEHSEE
jgi:hypothetical protein